MTKIGFESIDSIPQLVKDFLEKKLRGFENKIFDLENIRNQILEKQNCFSVEKRKLLYDVIFSQNQKEIFSEKQAENLSFLK